MIASQYAEHAQMWFGRHRRFLLGAAGLLDGMNATTHWKHTAELAARYPTANILPDHIYVEDGKLYTSVGVTAGIDLALKMIEEGHGRELARKVARNLIASFKNPNEGTRYSTYLTAQNLNEDRIRDVQCWILDHLSLDLTLTTLAGKAALSMRHFVRLFQQEAGNTPADFVEGARVSAAQKLLEESDLLLRQIAKCCGVCECGCYAPSV